MWEYRNHFCIEDVDDVRVTQSCGVEVEFSKSRHVIHHDQNLIGGMLGYVKNIQEIIRVDFSSFQCVIFRCRWWDTFDRNNVKEDRDIGLICIKSIKMWDESKDIYVFPKHYNQVLFYPIVLDKDWSFILRQNPRSKHLF